jgi:hypothetical protein
MPQQTPTSHPFLKMPGQGQNKQTPRSTHHSASGEFPVSPVPTALRPRLKRAGTENLPAANRREEVSPTPVVKLPTARPREASATEDDGRLGPNEWDEIAERRKQFLPESTRRLIKAFAELQRAMEAVRLASGYRRFAGLVQDAVYDGVLEIEHISDVIRDEAVTGYQVG